MRPEMFVRPRKTRGPGSAEPEISVQRSGRLGVNVAALAMLGIEPGTEVILYWYADAGQVGLRPAKEKDPAAARFLIDKNRHISAKPLFVHYGIDIDQARGRYPLGLDPTNGLHLFQLPREARPQSRPAAPSPLAERLRKAG